MMKVMTDLNGGFRMMQKVLGYVIEDSIVKEEEAKILTHINVAFGHLTMNGSSMEATGGTGISIRSETACTLSFTSVTNISLPYAKTKGTDRKSVV